MLQSDSRCWGYELASTARLLVLQPEQKDALCGDLTRGLESWGICNGDTLSLGGVNMKTPKTGNQEYQSISTKKMKNNQSKHVTVAM
eukprot:7505975-Pyramimonas_sp.AAC.1